MPDDFVTDLLPILGRTLDQGFNVFDVMHHGTHEKQLSNVFAWLLDVGGTHQLGDLFIRLFIDELQKSAMGETLWPTRNYTVRQEVNVGDAEKIDIADLVLESDGACIVVENYFTSDGHGHNYQRYLDYSTRDDRQGRVVLLCRDEDRSRLAHGWERAAVVTYSTLIEQLHTKLPERFSHDHPEVHFFLEQIHRKFVAERNLVSEKDVLRFVTTLTQTGEAERYANSPQNESAEQFASDVAVQARQRFVEGRELLQRLKGRLKAFSEGPLRDQLIDNLGSGSVHEVSTPFRGIYQWTVSIEVRPSEGPAHPVPVYLVFGPSAHFVNQQASSWEHTVDPRLADYSYVFVAREDVSIVCQSEVTLDEMLDGLSAADLRLHDEILELVKTARPSQP